MPLNPNTNKPSAVEKLRRIKPAEGREKSWGAQQTDRAKSELATSRFGKPNLPAERKLDVPVTRAQRTAGGTIMDAQTLAAKSAMEQSKTDAARTASIMKTATAIANDRATGQAFALGWMASTPAFFQSAFNAQSLAHAVEEVIVKTGRPLSSELFNECFEFLVEHNYLEKPVRHRGEIAARMYPAYDVPVAPTRTPIGTAISTRRTPADPILPAGSNARTMPMDELRRAVRATYKPEGSR